MSSKEPLLRFARTLVVSAFGVISTFAYAVHVSPRGVGQVLLFPYYTVRSTTVGNIYNTLFLITNTASDTKVVRVRFRESQNGREVASVNLFLTPFDSWSGGIVPAISGPELFFFDQSCVEANPAAGQGSIPFSHASYSGAAADGGDQTLARATEGYFEAIEMGVVQDPTALAALQPNRGSQGSVVPDCATALAVPLDNITKVSPPTGGLTGSGFIINVLDGTLYSYDATALDDFSSVASWAPVTAPSPTLQDVNPKASDVLDISGNRHATWDTTKGAHSADPVSAVLMQDQLLNYFVLDTGTNSQTDWVVTMPTKPFYVDPALIGSLNALPPFEKAFAGGAPDYFGNLYDTQVYDREGDYTYGGPSMEQPPVPIYLSGTANVVTFLNYTFNNGGNLLGASASTNIFTVYLDGWVRLVPFQYPSSSVHQLVSTDVPPVTYFGLPMIGFMANDYVNGTLSGPTGPVLSNYGATSPHKGLVRVQ